MKTPAGKYCRYFYADYFRGRELEECRLVEKNWQRTLCSSCPVPNILQANACSNLRINASVAQKIMAGFKKRIYIKVYCEKTGRFEFDPYIGCGECHPIPPVFLEEK